MTVEIDDADVARVLNQLWATLEPAATDYLDRVAPTRFHARRRRRVAALTVVLLAAGVGGTAAAVAVLGSPAPPSVQASLESVDDGLPADLRLHPDASRARSVAAAGTAVLYVADLPGGGYCTEIAVDGRPKGAVCRTASQATESVLEVTVPGTPEDVGAQVTVAGRASMPVDAIELQIAADDRVPVVLAEGGFFIVQLDAARSAAARAGLRIEATRAGEVIESRDLTTAFAPETGTIEPISVEMVSGPNDLTLVSSFYGTVHVPGAATVRLAYPDGTTQDAVVAADGRFDLSVPSERHADFASRPGLLTALDASGSELASRTVAAVSFWVRAERGG